MDFGTIKISNVDEGKLLEFLNKPEVYICWPETCNEKGELIAETPYFERVTLISIETHCMGDIMCGDYLVRYTSNGKLYELHLGAFQVVPNQLHLDQALKDYFTL